MATAKTPNSRIQNGWLHPIFFYTAYANTTTRFRHWCNFTVVCCVASLCLLILNLLSIKMFTSSCRLFASVAHQHHTTLCRPMRPIFLGLGVNLWYESSSREVTQHRNLSTSQSPPTQPLGRQLCEKLNFVSLSGGCKVAALVSVKGRKKEDKQQRGEGGKIEGGKWKRRVGCR